VAWGAMGLTLIFFYVLGLRGLRLFLATVVMWFPVLLICIFVLDRLVPPRLVPYRSEDSRPHDSGSSLLLR
jgi:p-aminobenzoyl-glutamate transporter AbgT